MVSNRRTQQVINMARDNIPYNPNNGINQRNHSGTNSTAANALHTTILNEYYASTNTETTSRDKTIMTTVTTKINHVVNNKNLLNDDNKIENCTITRYEDNAVFNTFTNNEGMIEDRVEVDSQAVIEHEPPTQRYPPSTNDADLALNQNVG